MLYLACQCGLLSRLRCTSKSPTWEAGMQAGPHRSQEIPHFGQATAVQERDSRTTTSRNRLETSRAGPRDPVSPVPMHLEDAGGRYRRTTPERSSSVRKFTSGPCSLLVCCLSLSLSLLGFNLAAWPVSRTHHIHGSLPVRFIGDQRSQNQEPNTEIQPPVPAHVLFHASLLLEKGPGSSTQLTPI